MPKIIIREYDNSTTGSTAVNSFAVVVPGFCGTPTAGYNPEDVFDSNGVAEFNSQADFKNYIGLRSAEAVEATEPELYTINKDADEGTVAKYALSSANQIIKGAGNVVKFIADEISYSIYKLVETAGAKAGYLSLELTASSGTKTGYKLELVTNYDDVVTTNTSGDKIIKAGESFVALISEGTNAAVESTKGNQIAYELLGLGYTILFKKIELTANKGIKDVLGDSEFWRCLKDRTKYNFRYLMSGGVADAAVATQMVNVATFNNAISQNVAGTIDDDFGRGDVIALTDIDEDIDESNIGTVTTTKALLNVFKTAIDKLPASKYSAIFGPQVIYSMSATETNPFGGNCTFPASFHYLACAAYAQERFAEWYAVAGYTRGISARTVVGTTYKLGDIENNTLAPRVTNTYAEKAVNLVIYDHGTYYLWGNRTAEKLNANGLLFSHFLNIRQICTTIKKIVYSVCRTNTFEPNSSALWTAFTQGITPTLDAMVADQGIKGYQITQVATSAKATLKANIRIIPIEAVEDFDISLYLEDSIDGIIISADESAAE